VAYVIMKLHNAVGDVFRAEGGLWTRDPRQIKYYAVKEEAERDLQYLRDIDVDLPSIELIPDRVAHVMINGVNCD